MRRAGILAAVVAIAACFAAASASAAPLLWSVNSSTGSVSTLEAAGGHEVGLPIKTGEQPNAIAITPDGRRAYVTNFAGDSITVIDTATRTSIKTIPLSANPESIAISPDGKTAYVPVKGGERVFAIDTESNTVTGSFVAGPEASVLALSPNGEAAYVGVGLDQVQMIFLQNGAPMGPPIKVGGLPRAIAVSPDGKAAYVAAGNEVDVIEGGVVTKQMPLGSAVSGLAVSPDGTRVYVTSGTAKTVITIDTATGRVTGAPLLVGGEPDEIALTANGRSAYVATGETIVPINLTTGIAGTPISRTGDGVSQLVVAPDQPPTAAFNSPEAMVGVPATFSGAPSSDPDGSIATYQWRTNFGGSPTGIAFTYTFAVVDSYFTMLTVTDEEGCGAVRVFTGRTAYCNGGPVATVTHPVRVSASPPVCRPNFGIRGLSHNRKNGTVRLRLKFNSTGSFLLFGRKIHAVTRKVRRPGVAVVTLHARVELNKQLKKTLRASVRYRVTFTPAAGCGSKTVHRSVALLRAPRHKHRR